VRHERALGTLSRGRNDQAEVEAPVRAAAVVRDAERTADGPVQALHILQCAGDQRPAWRVFSDLCSAAVERDQMQRNADVAGPGEARGNSVASNGSLRSFRQRAT